MPNYQIGKRLSETEIASLGEETVVLARFKTREEIGTVKLLRSLGAFDGGSMVQVFSVEVVDVIPDDVDASLGPGVPPKPVPIVQSDDYFIPASRPGQDLLRKNESE